MDISALQTLEACCKGFSENFYLKRERIAWTGSLATNVMLFERVALGGAQLITLKQTLTRLRKQYGPGVVGSATICSALEQIARTQGVTV